VSDTGPLGLLFGRQRKTLFDARSSIIVPKFGDIDSDICKYFP